MLLKVLPVPHESDFRSGLRGPEVAARVGVWLGICFAVAFLTGVYSHLYQDQPVWLTLPTRPVWLYQVTQGLHVIAGTAAVPLLLVKLWSVYPKLFAGVPWRDVRQLALHLAERASIAVLVAASIFQLATGLANSAQWYPWGFSFRSTHFALGWIAIGALVLHIAVKLPKIRDALGRPVSSGEGESSGLSRRGLVRTAFGASAVAVLSTAGASVPWLREVSVFSTHSGDGPAGVPINKSARAADVTARATAPSYTLTVVHGDRSVSLTRDELERMPQHTATLPIACVEGWSASGTWTGVRLRDLLDLVAVPAGTTVAVLSLQESGPFRSSEVRGNYADDPLTLVALRLNGQVLGLDHGYPCRLIAPDRPGVLQTKWLHRVEA
ncbi:MAG: molybdopterin-dependent oxidoreductase [Actinomycetota bacterium]|nr:molybdopterin-dependent oxidoreductase [Actinomycetota bacterium]